MTTTVEPWTAEAWDAFLTDYADCLSRMSIAIEPLIRPSTLGVRVHDIRIWYDAYNHLSGIKWSLERMAILCFPKTVPSGDIGQAVWERVKPGCPAFMYIERGGGANTTIFTRDQWAEVGNRVKEVRAMVQSLLGIPCLGEYQVKRFKDVAKSIERASKRFTWTAIKQHRDWKDVTKVFYGPALPVPQEVAG